MKVSPYDLWKEKADRTNYYVTSWRYRRTTVMMFLLAMLASVALNIYLSITLC